jgi:DNA-binding GntR family transcriptional regulator
MEKSMVRDQEDASEASLAEHAYRAIEELIVTLRLPPGTVISEMSLSKRLGIGRTPTREALHRLARERLVVIMPRRGIFISEINVATQLRLVEARRELERLIARAAAKRATDEERARLHAIGKEMEAAAVRSDDQTFLELDREFHDLLPEAARNEFASSSLGLMNGLARRFWYLHYRQVADLPRIAGLHAAIARAVAAKDANRAGDCSDALLDYIEEFTRATLEVSLNG